jgi:hypothetical protein
MTAIPPRRPSRSPLPCASCGCPSPLPCLAQPRRQLHPRRPVELPARHAGAAHSRGNCHHRQQRGSACGLRRPDAGREVFRSWRPCSRRTCCGPCACPSSPPGGQPTAVLRSLSAAGARHRARPSGSVYRFARVATARGNIRNVVIRSWAAAANWASSVRISISSASRACRRARPEYRA